MGTDIQLFNFGESQVRVIINEKQEPEFCASDVCKVLGYLDGRKAVLTHCKSSGVSKRNGLNAIGKNFEYTYISEANLYRLIMRSTLPEAERFEAWVMEEVLPSIRKHGTFLTNEVIEKTLADPDYIISIATALKAEREEKNRLKEQNIALAQTIVEVAPKVEYHDTVLNSKTSYTSTQIAKELGMSAVTLNEKLHNLGVQYKVNGTWVLYHKYQDRGFTKTTTHHYTDSQGNTGTKMQTEWTETGREFIHSVLNPVLKKSRTSEIPQTV